MKHQESAVVRKDCLLSSNKSSSALSTQCLRNHSFRILSLCSFYRTNLFVCCAGFFSPPLGLSEPSVATVRRLTLRLSTAITSLHCSLRDWRRKVEKLQLQRCSKQAAVQQCWSRDEGQTSFWFLLLTSESSGGGASIPPSSYLPDKGLSTAAYNLISAEPKSSSLWPLGKWPHSLRAERWVWTTLLYLAFDRSKIILL